MCTPIHSPGLNWRVSPRARKLWRTRVLKNRTRSDRAGDNLRYLLVNAEPVSWTPRHAKTD